MHLGGQWHMPATLPPGITENSLYRRLSGPYSWSGWMGRRENLLEPQIDQPTGSFYNGYIPLVTTQ